MLFYSLFSFSFSDILFVTAMAPDVVGCTRPANLNTHGFGCHLFAANIVARLRMDREGIEKKKQKEEDRDTILKKLIELYISYYASKESVCST